MPWYGKKFGCTIEPKDINVVYRVSAKNESNIIGRFRSRTKKPNFAFKARKARVTTGVIDFRKEKDETLKAVFVNNHLTPEIIGCVLRLWN